MTRAQFWLTGVACLTAMVWANAANAQTQAPAAGDKLEKTKAAAFVPLGEVSPHFREGVKLTIEKPALYTQGPLETFVCEPQTYYWLVAHPDRGVLAWRKLGAQCVMIADRGAGRFGWTDEHGSDLQWETVFESADRHIWYAEGKVRPAPLFPLVPVKAVVVLRYSEQPSFGGKKMMQHQADMFLYTDSVGATLATKLLGAAAPKMAEQCVAQMEMFFGGLAWYLHHHPERAAELLAVTPSPMK